MQIKKAAGATDGDAASLAETGGPNSSFIVFISLLLSLSSLLLLLLISLLLGPERPDSGAGIRVVMEEPEPEEPEEPEEAEAAGIQNDKYA